MVDETQPDFLQIDEDEDSGVSNFTAFDLLQQPSKFKEELEKQYKVEDDLAEQSIQNYVDQFGRLKNYPKTIDLGDPLGRDIFKTPEEREETSVSLSPAYKVGADFFYTIGNKFPELIDNNKYAQLFGSLKGASGTAKFLWKDVHEIFGKMEMGKDITPMEGGTALLSLADFSFVGSLFTKAPKALEPVSNYLKRLGVPEKEVTTKALKVITENPQHIDEYAGAVDITELSDEAYDKLNLNAAVPPRKKETRPVKTTEVEGPVTIKEVIEEPPRNLAGTTPRDTFGKVEEPKDPFLTPDEPIAAPVEKIKPKTIEEVKEVKAKIDAVDVAQFQIFQDLPKGVRGAGLNPQKQKILFDFVEIMKSGDPFRIAALYRKTPEKTLRAMKKAAQDQKLITGPEIAAARKQGEIVGLKTATDKAQDLSIRASNQLEKWKAGEIENEGGGKLTFRKLIEAFKEDPELAKHIGDEVPMGDKNVGGGLKNLTNEEKWLLSLANGKLQNVLKLLKPQLDEFPLASPYAIRETQELTKYVKDFESVLIEPQRIIFKNVRDKLREKLKNADFPTDPIRGKDFLGRTAKRIIQSGGTPEEALEQIKNIDVDRLAELLIGREKFNVERQFYNDELEDVANLFGDGKVPFERVELGHIEAVEENIERTLEMNNLFFQGRGANRAEQDIRKEIKQLKALFKEATTGDEKRNIITKMMDLDKQLAESGSITKIDGQSFGAMPEDDFLDIGEDILDEMKYAKGGIVEERPAGPGLPEDLDIFQDDLPEGSYEVANLMLPLFKAFGKAPVNEVAPIPTPKEKLANPTKKQKESLEREKEVRSQEDIFDPTPDEKVEIGTDNPIEVTPLTNQPMTSVFYSDIERAMTNAPDQFANKQEVLDFLNKNRIKKSEVDDYRIASLLKLYDDASPISKTEIISQVRSAPISGMRVHATGQGSEMINPNGVKRTRYEGYYEPGSIPETQRERVLYLDRNKLPGDSGDYPVSMFGGENLNRHEFGIPNEEDTYIVGWTRLSDRYGFVPPKVEGPQTKINVSKLTKEKTKNERSLQGLYAEAKNKIGRLASQRGMSAADLNDILLDFGSDIPKLSVIAKYADQLDEVSPGLVNQMDELVVKNNELQEQITKASGVDPSGVVRVTFADEIQSDLLQAAAGRKQQLAAALRKIQEDGVGAGTNIEGLNRTAQAAIEFFEKNKSVFRPLTKTEDEVNVVAQRISKLETEVDEIVNNYIATREIDQPEIDRLAGLLNDNINNMLDEVLSVDSNTMAGLFPDLPFKNRDEWADALIKKDLYELAYRKFVLKDPDASSYYAISPSKYVIERYRFKGNAATPEADRAADKARRFDAFKRNGQFLESEYKGIGMDEFYGGPNAVSNVIDNSGTAATNPNFGKPKHYTSTLETILKKQAQSNNSEMITMPVQLKSGRGSTQYRVTDQNGNMVATLTNEDQARELLVSNPNYRIQPITIPSKKDMEPVFAIKITPEMLEPYKTHKAQGGLVEHIDIFEV